MKKKEFVDTTEEFAQELFEEYKTVYVGGTGTMAEDRTLAVNTAQQLFECCGYAQY